MLKRPLTSHDSPLTSLFDAPDGASPSGPLPSGYVHAAAPLAGSAASGPISMAVGITGLDIAITENFDTLASTGTSGIVPNGWAFSEAGTNANGTYTAGTGSTTGGDTYSFGSAGSADRAFGTLQSGSLMSTIGVSFSNDSGATIGALDVAYVGEQWRLGQANRGADRLDFQYSLDATSLTSGTWTDVNALDFNSPVTTGSTGALDGNAAANRTSIASTISGLNLASGGTVWFRWVDFNATGSDDGLAVDDFSLTAHASRPRRRSSSRPRPSRKPRATATARAISPSSSPVPAASAPSPSPIPSPDRARTRRTPVTSPAVRPR